MAFTVFRCFVENGPPDCLTPKPNFCPDAQTSAWIIKGKKRFPTEAPRSPRKIWIWGLEGHFYYNLLGKACPESSVESFCFILDE